MSLQVKYIDVPEGAQTSAVASGQGQPFSVLSQVIAGSDGAAYATLERTGWPLDGSRVLMPDAPAAGFWSERTSDEAGLLSDAPVITVQLDQMYTTSGITLQFAPETGEWCSKVQVVWYSGNDILAQQMTYPTEAYWVVQQPVEGFNKVQISLLQTNKPGHFAKLRWIGIGQTVWFGEDELVSVQLINELDPTLSDLTADTMRVSVQDRHGRTLIPRENQVVELYRNGKLLATQYIEKSSREASSRYDFSCQSAIALMKDDYLGGIYENVPVPSVLADIMQDAAYTLHSSYRTVTVTGYLPLCSRREALQQLCFAIGAAVTTQGSGAVQIAPLSDNIVGVFRKSEIFPGSKLETASRVAKVEITAHSYRATNEEKVLLEEEAVYGDDVLLTFQEPYHSYSIQGGQILESGANFVRIRAEGNVTLTAKTYLHSTTRYSRGIPNITMAERGNVHYVDGATLVHRGNAAAVLDRVFRMSRLRQTLSHEAVIHDQKAGQRVSAESPWGGQLTGFITAMESDLTRNGHTAKVTILGQDVQSVAAVNYAGELFAGNTEVLY